MSKPSAGPLASLRILDMSQGIAGPSCAGHFAEFGADVVKIEPPEGDWMRPLGSRVAGTSPQAVTYNRGKQSLAIDLKSSQGRDIALQLAAKSHVAIESARPGVMERLGLGFQALKAVRPDIIYVSISGFGQTGPNREAPLVDALAQAKSGLMSVMRSREGAPVKMDATLIDAITGLYAFQAASMALWGRQPGSEARHIDISLMQAAAHIQAPNILEWDYVGKAPGVLNPPAGNYRTKDGFLVLTTVTEAQFKGIFQAIGQPEIATDARFATMAARKTNLAELRAIVDAALATRTTTEWIPAFEKAGALASAISTYGDWLADEHAKAVGSAPAYTFATGETARIPHLPGQPPNTAPVPGIGEHSREVLAELGLARGDIEALIASGVVRCPKPA